MGYIFATSSLMQITKAYDSMIKDSLVEKYHMVFDDRRTKFEDWKNPQISPHFVINRLNSRIEAKLKRSEFQNV